MMLNDLAEKDSYALPEMRRIIEATAGSNFFTILDLKEGYYQIEILEEHKHKTAFEFEEKVYEWNGMVMGYKNAPMIFQRIMNKILGEKLGSGVQAYLDDIIIYAKTIEEHDELVKWVFEKLKKHNLKVNVKKVQFAQNSVKLLGVTVNGKDKTPMEIKRNETLEFPRPRSVAELRRFLGLVGWFREFIPNFANLTKELYGGLSITKRHWEWSMEMEKSFIKVKTALREARGLRLPDYNKEFTLKTDASNTGLGAVLLQKDEGGRLVPIQWASKKLTATEERYGITEKEMLAIMWGMEKFSYELKGRTFHLITDHKALEQLRKKPEFENNRINRWVEKIQQFDFTIEYKKGEELVTADALSRLYEEERRKPLEDKKKNKDKHGQKVKDGVNMFLR
jgi:RNase H-like domain found in reverse transcriptase/Reverse transcriptase (RNA-dependent DNA polymerase)